MALYELRTYTLYVGKLGEAIEIYKAKGWPVLQKHEKHLVGYFTGDVGGLNQIVHLWKFADDNDRRRFWGEIYGDEDFQNFAKEFRPLIQSQENKLLLGAPWGPTP